MRDEAAPVSRQLTIVMVSAIALAGFIFWLGWMDLVRSAVNGATGVMASIIEAVT